MVEPYAVHCTFQYGGNIGKRNRMREAMIFEDNSTYYGMGGRESFVSFDLEKTPSMSPKEFKRLNYTQKKLYNIQGIDMQMDSVWPAMGLSHLFGRTLIMPKFTSYCDRYWTPLDDCRVPGALSQRLPFEAPMDYILDPIGMSDDASPDFQVSWREASFLANPRCPESIKRSKITIYSSKAASEVTERFSLKDGGKSFKCFFLFHLASNGTNCLVVRSRGCPPSQHFNVAAQDGSHSLCLRQDLALQEPQRCVSRI